MSFPSDLDIARSVTPRPIVDIAAELGLRRRRARAVRPDEGQGHARGDHAASRRSGRAASTSSSRRSRRRRSARASRRRPSGSPRASTGSASEAAVNIRQPSLGPVFGIKGGAAGGGYSQVIPMEDFNLHLTGDVHAIGAAHNLAARVPRQQPPPQEPARHRPARRSSGRGSSTSATGPLRHVVIGLGGTEDGVPRETEFVITVASEVMAVLALATDLHDLRARLGRIVLATHDRRHAGHRRGPRRRRLDDRAAARRDQAEPAPDARGRAGVRPLRAVRATSPTATTRSSRTGWRWPRTRSSARRRASGPTWAPRSSSTSSAGRPGSRPDAAVVVATVRALKMHGGVGKIVAGKPLDPALLEENVEAVRTGAVEPRQADRERPPVRRPGGRGDQLVPDRHARPRSRRSARWRSRPAPGTRSSPRTSPTAARGATDLAEAVWAAAERPVARSSGCSIPTTAPLGEKILTIATKIYGADGIELLPAAQKSLKLYEDLGLRAPAGLHGEDAVLAQPRRRTLKGRPSGFTVPIRDIRLSAGAGFITPLLRRDADDAGAAVAAGRREDRHRRRRQHRRPVLVLV